MTASQIIDEIKSLPPDEQAGVVRFVYQLDAERKLSGPELSALAARLVEAADPAEASRVPEIRRRNLPPALLDHLLDRVRSREISPEQLREFAQWLDTAPEVPMGKWFKRFTGMIVCGEGELVKTFLNAQQLPVGKEVF